MSRTVLNIIITISAVTAIYLDYVAHSAFGFAKALTTTFIILLPVLFAKQAPRTFRNTVIFALIFCLLGDVLLIKQNYFVFGLGAFLIGHLLFAVSFYNLERTKPVPWAFALLILIAGGIFYWLSPNLGAMRIPVSIYILVITVMATIGVSLFIRHKKLPYGLIAVAVLLFMFSDSIIAVNKFKNPLEWASIVILTTYWLSIGLIANACSLVKKEEV